MLSEFPVHVCVVVPAGWPGGVIVVTAFGGRPGAVFGTGVFGAIGDGETGFVVLPSAPCEGSGAGPGIPCAVGVWVLEFTGCVIAGGSFW
jgi:hypothetical protein